jgi:hypothetical protein
VLHIKKKIFFKFILISVYFFFLEKFIDVKDVDEKEAILKSLRDIAVDTKEQCVALIDDLSIGSKILCFLPGDDRSNMNIEVVKKILNVLVNFTEKLFNQCGKEERIQFKIKLEGCHFFGTLFSLLNIYEDISLRLLISIILANMCKYVFVTEEQPIIIDILINYLKKQSTKKPNEDKNKISVLNALVNITEGGSKYKNKKVVLDGGTIPLLLPLVDSSDTIVWQRTVTLLSNICTIRSVEDKNSIIKYGIFDVFHKKLLEISPFPPQKMISSNYFLIYRIIAGIDNLLHFNRSGVISFLKTPLIPLLLHTLDSTISIGNTPSDEDIKNTSSDEDIGNIQQNICGCFLKCTLHCYKVTFVIVRDESDKFTFKYCGNIC